jgi:hypothetical protein
MKEVSVHRDPTVVGFHKSILDEAGIDCFIRNEHSSASLGAGGFGLVQSPIFDPALCIADDARYDEAVALLKSATTPSLETARIGHAQSAGKAFPATSMLAGIALLPTQR